jgi:hypothetical protein
VSLSPYTKTLFAVVRLSLAMSSMVATPDRGTKIAIERDTVPMLNGGSIRTSTPGRSLMVTRWITVTSREAKWVGSSSSVRYSGALASITTAWHFVCTAEFDRPVNRSLAHADRPPPPEGGDGATNGVTLTRGSAAEDCIMMVELAAYLPTLCKDRTHC